jgi:peptidoglycan glycosyltransferase
VTKQIRRLGVAFIVCYVALFGMVNYWQVIAADELQSNPDNTRAILRDFNRPRGTIETADGVLLARTVETDGEQFQYQREYPEGARYGHLTGWFSFDLGASGIERQYNDELAGNTIPLQIRSFGDLFVDHDTTGDVILSIEDSVQRVAEQQLGDREGSVVVLDPRDGRVLALWSNPSYDPNVLSSHDTRAATAAKQELDEAPGDPLLAHTYQERYFPGSTFKIVTAGAGLDSGRVTESDPNYPVATEYVPPQTTVGIHNFGGSACGGTLVPIIQDSCNTAFAEMAAETLGPDIMIDGAERVGFNSAPPIDLPDPARSFFPTNFDQNLPALAQAGIGQNDVQGTPLQMALVAAGVANGGEIMRPTVMEEIRASDGDVVDRADPEVWRNALDPADAATLRDAMIATVQGGTAFRMAIPGMEVGGKTGTAETGLGPDQNHAWIIGFAGPPGEEARVAIAVLVEARPGQDTQSGGTVAAPIARAVLEAALAVSEADGDAGDDEDEEPSEDTRPANPGTVPDDDGPAPTVPVTTAPAATIPATTAPPATAPPTTEPTTAPPTTGPPATGPPTSGP